MGGALLDLVAKGGQDVYFISNPQISFFKKVYKRHTNFSIEFNKFFLDTDADFGKMTRIFIPKKGDLIKNLCLHLQLPNLIPNGDAVSYINFIEISASVMPKLHTSLADVNFIVSMLSGAVHRTGNTPVDDL